MNQTFSLIVTNDPGVLLRVCGAFARRGYNITSLTLKERDTTGSSQIEIAAVCTEGEAVLLVRQLNKLIDVWQVKKL
ncbi:ACT domain-containing protein (plasmid) [Alkalihalophilus pseudofirmus]|uniref:ACT domain-containing protein n=1 Tax=Alkalihalophilus pseudofirmus TaxID=79885 RepID=UPI00259B767B|nr:ACT domain-containing protein [Alkalihalophilus pseudofirmus]WEG19180.1 ACT domain-containing protein [Alkalihalophilus pseudofirmus]